MRQVLRLLGCTLAIWLLVQNGPWFAFASDAKPAAGIPHVYALTLAGPINPVAASYVARGLRQAEAARADALVLRLDTPGGLDSSMREIIQQMISARVPVIVYVAPRGARAASAGMYITVAAHVAAMAPDTAIGAAHPVAGGGEEIKGPMAAKVTNDAAAYARGLATARGRNAAWIESAVRQSVSISAAEALKLHVIDRVAPSTEALLDAIDGTKVTVRDVALPLHTRHSLIAELPMSTGEHLLYSLANPELALILMNLGVLGIIFELQNPTGLLAGIAGVLCLLLGLFALGMLPVNGAGVALILFGLALFATELFIPSYGLLTAGGVVALILGGLMLFHTDMPGLAPALPLLLGLPLAVGSVVLAGSFLAIKAQRRRVAVGVEHLVGSEAEVRVPLKPAGMVFLEGELWRAQITGREPVFAGDRVVVDRVEGLTLHVHKKPSDPGT